MQAVAQERGGVSGTLLGDYMAECRTLALDELRRILPSTGSVGKVLYGRMLDYPMRDAKALRPALCIATCRALGGTLESVLKTAAVLELYHNAFLIHDDVEDGSDMRRNAPTLHKVYGVPIAVNIGDAMLAAALEPLLQNMAVLGLGKALRILQTVATMARESAEGQATELDWVRSGHWQLRQTDYLRMVHQKTTWYSFLSPMELGGLAAGASELQRYRLRRFATSLGAAFQIQDDVLNLSSDEARYGKETAGDLWEGKHTLILSHVLRSCTDDERRVAIAILAKRRPPSLGLALLPTHLDALAASGDVSPAARRSLAELIDRELLQASYRTQADIDYLSELIRRYRSCDDARRVARTRAARARKSLQSLSSFIPPSVHRDFLEGLVEFVTDRDR